MLTKRHNAILRVEDTLLHMGYEVEKIYVDHFQSSHSYLLKKLDEIGVSKFKEEYERSIYDKACHIIQNMDVKRVLCINFILPEKYREKFKKLLKNKCPNILWLVDPINRNDDIYISICFFNILIRFAPMNKQMLITCMKDRYQ